MDEKMDAYQLDDTTKHAQTDLHKCPGCGANMTFNPDKQLLECEFCGQSMDFKKDSAVKEKDLEEAFDVAEKWDETTVISCDNCGAKFVISSTEVAAICPYCETSHVRKSADLAGIKPNAIYPFLFSAKNAEQISKKWAKRKLFAPRRFKKSIEANNLHGVYQPGFTFDSNTFSVYDGVLGEVRTRTVRTKNGYRTETYTHYFPVSGTLSFFFDDVTIGASSDFDNKSYNKLAPFTKESIKVYTKDYLAGFSAKHYEKDLKTCWQDAKSVIDNRIRNLIVRKYNADTVSYLNVSTMHENVTFKYVLYPIYLLNYRFKQKIYNIAVNGNTGKVVGKTPVSFWRVLIAVLIGLGLIALAAFLFINFA